MSLNILVVDDSETVRAVISKMLELAGVPVAELFEASNGKEALDILDNHLIDLVFTDINMPVMTGIEMIEKMCENDLLKTVPVIIVSTEGSSARFETLKSKGIRAFLRKPFIPEQIKNIVDNVVGEKHKKRL